jgi:hypothetical protein
MTSAAADDLATLARQRRAAFTAAEQALVARARAVVADPADIGTPAPSDTLPAPSTSPRSET